MIDTCAEHTVDPLEMLYWWKAQDPGEFRIGSEEFWASSLTAESEVQYSGEYPDGRPEYSADYASGVISAITAAAGGGAAAMAFPCVLTCDFDDTVNKYFKAQDNIFYSWIGTDTANDSNNATGSGVLNDSDGSNFGLLSSNRATESGKVYTKGFLINRPGWFRLTCNMHYAANRARTNVASTP